MSSLSIHVAGGCSNTRVQTEESEGLSPAQLSPPSGTATACCSHIANGGVGVHVFVFNVCISLNSAAPARFAPLGTLQFSHVTPPFGRNLF